MISTTFNLNTVEYFLLILVRISCFVYAAPFFGQSNMPRRVKVGLALVLSILVSFSISPEIASYTTTYGYGVMVLIEGITGLLIGFMANICNSIILFAGNMIDTHVGFSMAQDFNPSLNMQTTVSGDLYYYFLMMLLIVTNMHQYILKALIDTFSIIPLGGAVLNTDSLLTTMLKFVTDMLVISFRITLPVFACVMILDVVLGIMARVAPQMNMFAVGIQIKVIVGLAVMFLTIFLLPDVSNFIFKEMKDMINLVVKGLT